MATFLTREQLDALSVSCNETITDEVAQAVLGMYLEGKDSTDVFLETSIDTRVFFTVRKTYLESLPIEG